MANLMSYLEKLITGWPTSFISGVISGILANLIWHKIIHHIQNKEGAHFSMKHSKDGFAFTGLMDQSNADHIKSLIDTAAKTTKKQESPSTYDISKSANKTTSQN